MGATSATSGSCTSPSLPLCDSTSLILNSIVWSLAPMMWQNYGPLRLRGRKTRYQPQLQGMGLGTSLRRRQAEVSTTGERQRDMPRSPVTAMFRTRHGRLHSAWKVERTTQQMVHDPPFLLVHELMLKGWPDGSGKRQAWNR